jgi:FtsH-binding integral membrane protein
VKQSHAIASAFMSTADMFGATSLFGYVTKKDLQQRVDGERQKRRPPI